MESAQDLSPYRKLSLSWGGQIIKVETQPFHRLPLNRCVLGKWVWDIFLSVRAVDVDGIVKVDYSNVQPCSLF